VTFASELADASRDDDSCVGDASAAAAAALAEVSSRLRCQGLAGSQHPTEPVLQGTVHCGQHLPKGTKSAVGFYAGEEIVRTFI